MVFFHCPSLSMQRPTALRRSGVVTVVDDEVESECQWSPPKMGGRRLRLKASAVGGDDKENSSASSSSSGNTLRKRASAHSLYAKRRKTSHNNHHNNASHLEEEEDDGANWLQEKLHAIQQRQKKPVTVRCDYMEPLAPAAAVPSGPLKNSVLKFAGETHVKEIPSFRDYSEDEHSNMYTSTYQIKENAERNAREYRADHWDWINATEEEGFLPANNGEIVHPATFRYLEEEEDHRLKLLDMFDDDESLFGCSSWGYDNKDMWSDDEDDDDDEEEDVRPTGCCTLRRGTSVIPTSSSHPTTTPTIVVDYADFGMEISELDD